VTLAVSGSAQAQELERVTTRSHGERGSVFQALLSDGGRFVRERRCRPEPKGRCLEAYAQG
jgi:hypothetical protein